MKCNSLLLEHFKKKYKCQIPEHLRQPERLTAQKGLGNSFFLCQMALKNTFAHIENLVLTSLPCDCGSLWNIYFKKKQKKISVFQCTVLI